MWSSTHIARSESGQFCDYAQRCGGTVRVTISREEFALELPLIGVAENDTRKIRTRMNRKISIELKRESEVLDYQRSVGSDVCGSLR